MTENADAILSQLPARLKEARRDQGLSLDAVAKLSGVSRSMVSQIERGESSPTIATLLNLTRALQVDFAGLLGEADAEPGIEVLTEADLPVIDKLGQACRILILSAPEEVGRHEFYRLEFGHGGRLDSQPHRRGAREQFMVLTGAVTVSAGDDTVRLNAGDTARYAADQTHAIASVDGPATGYLLVRDA